MVNLMFYKMYITHILIATVLASSSVVFAQKTASVEVSTLSELAIYPERTAPATVISLNETGIAAEIPAKVEKVHADVGDIVDKGDPLVRLNCIDYELALEQAKARLASLNARIELAERRLERTRKLVKKQSVSEEIFDEREADLAVLVADRRAATATMNLEEVHVANCDINAPFRALLTERSTAVGHYAEVGKPLLQVIDIEQLEVSAQVFNQDTEQLTEKAQIFFEYAGRRYPLILRTIVPAVNTDTRNREVRLRFQNGPALPGAAGKLVWRDERPHVPGELLVRRGEQLGVFTIATGVARFVPLPSAQAGRASPVSLPAGTRLITQGHYSLKDDDPISVAE